MKSSESTNQILPIILVWIASFLILSMAVGCCQEPKNGASALLGGPDFLPTPEHPVGWRGDWSGRYPGAKPALEWSQHLQNAPGFACQLKKPVSDPTELDRTAQFPIKQWLVLGAFDKPNGDIGMSEDQVPPTVTPVVEGDKVDALTWTVLPMQNHLAHLAPALKVDLALENKNMWDVKSVKVAYAYSNVLGG